MNDDRIDEGSAHDEPKGDETTERGFCSCVLRCLRMRMEGYVEELDEGRYDEVDARAAAIWRCKLARIARKNDREFTVEDVLDAIPSYERWRRTCLR